MARKGYRRSRSPAASVMRDSTEIAARLPWWGTALFGIVAFVVLYYGMPAFLVSLAVNLEGNPYLPIVNVVRERREWLFHWLGIAVALVFGYFSVRNFVWSKRANRREKQAVGFLAKLLGRSMD